MYDIASFLMRAVIWLVLGVILGAATNNYEFWLLTAPAAGHACILVWRRNISWVLIIILIIIGVIEYAIGHLTDYAFGVIYGSVMISAIRNKGIIPALTVVSIAWFLWFTLLPIPNASIIYIMVITAIPFAIEAYYQYRNNW